MTAGDGPLILIGQSARAMAAASRRAGLAAVAIDFFADADTEMLARRLWRYPGAWRDGFSADLLLPMIERAAADGTAGVVLGSGFEDRTQLIDAVAARWPLLGSDGATVRKVKSPGLLFDFLDAAGIPHPGIALGAIPDDGGDWLVKAAGGSGGTHIRPGTAGLIDPGDYAQRRVPGRAVSVLCLGDGRAAGVIAFSEQWSDPAPGQLFRYAGALGPVDVPFRIADEVTAAVDAIGSAFGLRGLFGLDLIVDGETWWLLEINPRIGASLDALDRCDRPLLGAHVAACRGDLRLPRPRERDLGASEIVYARRPVGPLAGIDWPAWVADVPGEGQSIAAGDPIATVIATATTPGDCRTLIAHRTAALRRLTGDI